MKIFPAEQTREEYLHTQIRRSESKFKYCKVSAHDVRKYRKLVHQDATKRRSQCSGPIACLGSRNGREVDLFRLQWFGSAVLARLTCWLERTTQSFTSRLPPFESIGRSNVAALTPTSVVGIEVNPMASRRDVWVGSFDEMPDAWSGQFGVLFSNAFDQSEDPQRTAREWTRILRAGAFLILCFDSDQVPTISDRVGGLSLDDVRQLFGGRLVCFQDRGSRNGYSEVILQL